MLSDRDLERLVDRLLSAESEAIVRDLGGHVGEQIHAVLWRHGMTMRTVAGAVGMGVLAAAQVLNDTIAFAERSMGDGSDDADDRAAIRRAALEFFCRQVDGVTRK